jgi:Cu-Zn family superoxide dismutase
MHFSKIGLASMAVSLSLFAGCERSDQPKNEPRPEGMADPQSQRVAPGTRTAEPATNPAAGRDRPGVTTPVAVEEKPEELELALDALEGSEIDADLTLVPLADGVIVRLEVEDAPAGRHRVVIHEKGDCSNAAAGSFGEPLMTRDRPTAAGTAEMIAAGNVGEIRPDKDGDAKLEQKLVGMKLDKGSPNSLMGRSIVIHETEKSGRTNKDFGKPLACARITRKE